MFCPRTVATVVALSLLGGLAEAQRKKKKGKDREEQEVTQSLPVLRDPPAAVTADASRLVFRTSPLSNKGLLSPQTRDALKALIRDNRGATVIKLRAFVAGTGDVRRVQTLVSEEFTERRLPLPALTVVLSGGLAMEGAQVVLESVAAGKKPSHPHGLAFVAGRPADTAAESVAQVQAALTEIGLAGTRVLSATCFLGSLDIAAEARSALGRAFPAAALNVVQMQRVPVRPPCECEAVAALERPANGAVERRKGVTLASGGRLVFTGLQMAFGEAEPGVRLAFERLGRTLESQRATYKSIVSAHAYVLSPGAHGAFAKLQAEFLDGVTPAALTLLPFEGLPSVDATLGMDVVAAVP